MLRTIPANNFWIENVCEKMERSQFQFHEYLIIEDVKLKNFFRSKTNKLLLNPSSICIVIVSGEDPAGFISLVKDEFDSEIFGIDCYRIIDLIVLPTYTPRTEIIIKNLISESENLLNQKSNGFHISCGINNNTENSVLIFNCLVNSGYFYIHTLLTFVSNKFTPEALTNYNDLKLRIRTVKESDAEKVAKLAEEPFKFTRFHLDPFFDNIKASSLLRTSALNSILNGFADIMYVAEIDGELAGYYSARKRVIKEFGLVMGEVIISTVGSGYRGLGLFNKMDNHIQKWFAENTDFAEMGTYLGNYPVHKTWISKGLRLIRGTHQFSKVVKK